MVRFGRIIVNPAQVLSVLSNAKAKTTVVTLLGGKTHTFKKHAAAAWTYFKSSARNTR